MVLRNIYQPKEALQMKFIGMDAHSKTCFFVVLNQQGKKVRTQRVDTSKTTILEFVRSIKGPKALVFEEGVMSQWLFLLLKGEVDSLVVCQPQEHNGPKNDEIDATEIADLLRVGRLKTVFHADSEYMNLRTLVSGYDDLMGVLTREKNRYKALFRHVAIRTDSAKFYKDKELLNKLPTDTQHYVACTLFEQLELLEEQKRGYEERFAANAKKFKEMNLLMSIPGIGPIRANQLVAIMVTPHRFEDKYHLYSYAKLTKHNRESDGRQYGKSRANGQPILKSIFKSAVLGATKSGTSFRRKYESMRAKGSDDRAARGAVSRMIAATVLAIWKSGKKYNDKYKEVAQRRNRKRKTEVENL
jgi:transposase